MAGADDVPANIYATKEHTVRRYISSVLLSEDAATRTSTALHGFLVPERLEDRRMRRDQWEGGKSRRRFTSGFRLLSATGRARLLRFHGLYVSFFYVIIILALSLHFGRRLQPLVCFVAPLERAATAAEGVRV